MEEPRSPRGSPAILFRPDGSKGATHVVQSEGALRRSHLKSSLALILVLLLMAAITGIPGDSRDATADWSKGSHPARTADSDSVLQPYQGETWRATGASDVPKFLTFPTNRRETAGGKTADFKTDEIPNIVNRAVNGLPAGTSRSAAFGRGYAGSPHRALGAGGTATQAEITALSVGLEQTMTSIEANLVARVFADTLPLLGNHLAAEPVPNAPARHYLTTLKTAINSGLATLTGSPTYTEVQVETAWDPLESTCRHASLSIL